MLLGAVTGESLLTERVALEVVHAMEVVVELLGDYLAVEEPVELHIGEHIAGGEHLPVLQP